MQKKLTITVDGQVYEGLHKVIGPRRISRFIEELVRPHVTEHDLEAAYSEMAQDEVREQQALEWWKERFCQPLAVIRAMSMSRALHLLIVSELTDSV